MESLLRTIRTTSGSISGVTVPPGASHPVPVPAPLVLCGLVSGSAAVDDGVALEPGGVVVLATGVTVTAGDGGAVLLLCHSPAPTGMRFPEVAVIAPEGPDCATLLQLLERQLDHGSPTVRDRLVDWLVTCTLNAWYSSNGAGPLGWHTALNDPVVGPALAAMHAEPARSWSVAQLAAHSGLGRAGFAKRFRALVGSGPLAHLREWRMTLAAEYLTNPGTTVAAVARRVGYGNAFSFSAAFKRERGVTPSALRRND